MDLGVEVQLNSLVFKELMACGEIVKVGAGVEKNRVGERVLISPCMEN